MSRDNQATIVGNLTRDPELRFTQSGLAVCNFGVAWNPPPAQDGTEKDPSFFNCVAFRDLAENIVESFGKGDRAIIQGHFQSRQYESEKFHDEQGQPHKVTAVELLVEDIGPSLRWATAAVTRNEKKGGTVQAVEAQAVAAGYVPDEEPF